MNYINKINYIFVLIVNLIKESFEYKFSKSSKSFHKYLLYKHTQPPCDNKKNKIVLTYLIGTSNDFNNFDDLYLILKNHTKFCANFACKRLSKYMGVFVEVLVAVNDKSVCDLLLHNCSIELPTNLKQLYNWRFGERFLIEENQSNPAKRLFYLNFLISGLKSEDSKNYEDAESHYKQAIKYYPFDIYSRDRKILDSRLSGVIKLNNRSRYCLKNQA